MKIESTIRSMEDLWSHLSQSSTSGDVRKILDSIGDRPDLGLDESFGTLGLSWHAFGHNESNISSIGLATKPGRSLTERITNAIDAVLELRAIGAPTLPDSPRQAAKIWFGRPVTGADDGLYKWSYSDGDYDKRIWVVMLDSGVPDAPTIDVVDEGIGIDPRDFADTILSLQARNKIKKHYVIGAFGQGGASTLAFSDYAIIASRHHGDPSLLGFTLIRAMKLSSEYKEDCYAYLRVAGDNSQVDVASAKIQKGQLALYTDHGKAKVPVLTHGTLVRHIGFGLPSLAGRLGPAPGNLYTYLHYSAFDPLLPFRVVDLRDREKSRDEIVTGSRNRLMRLVVAKPEAADDIGSGSEMKHYRPMEFVYPLGCSDPAIGIEYWVVFNYRKSAKSGELTLRPNSNELYVQPGHPIVGTLNGQNQGEQTSRLLRDAGLGMISRHMVIHIEASRCDSKVRRELFATSREGFKEGPVLTDLLRILSSMISEDGRLIELERELTERLVQRETQSASEEVKRQVAQLLREAGFDVKNDGPAAKPGDTEIQILEREKRPRPVLPDPLPTLPFPDVTRFEIVFPDTEMAVHIGDTEVLLVETNADAEFGRRGLVHLRFEPPIAELAGVSPLKGGRIRWRVRPSAGVSAGSRGEIVATLTKLDGSQLEDRVPFRILEPIQEKASKVKGKIPPFDVYPIHPIEDEQQWVIVWPDFGVDATEDELSSVAYRSVRSGDKINIYYSTVFGPFRELVDRLKLSSEALLELFKQNYETWIAFHAILQDSAAQEGREFADSDAFSKLQEAERIRVGKLQVKESLRLAELTQRIISLQAKDAN